MKFLILLLKGVTRVAAEEGGKMPKTQHGNLFDGFSKLQHNHRLNKLLEADIINQEDISLLIANSDLAIELAEKFIENALGYFQLPLGIAVNFNINAHDYLVPMAVEEHSVIAAASKTAKWIRENGSISARNLGALAVGQIQFARIRKFAHFKRLIEQYKQELIADVNKIVAANMVKRGGGVKDILIRSIKRPDKKTMVILHVMVETCDAMGANLINQICEYLKKPIEKLTGETVTMCILSNLIDSKLTEAKVVVRNIDLNLGTALTEAALFAQLDPYRAATNNKGILNAIDAIAIATGNDWRAVEAGMHAYAAQSGQYRSLSNWALNGHDLVGTLTAPINVGTVGGVTQLHPIAKLCLKILGVENANELAGVMAAVGLVQNLGALKALTTEGIIPGHMRLHISNFCLAVGANATEIAVLKPQLELMLEKQQHISLGDATSLLAQLRETGG